MTSFHLLLSLLMVGLVACNQEVDIEEPNLPPRLVANAFLQTDSAVTLALTQSQSAYNNAVLETVSGATVVLWEGMQEIATLAEVSPGRYRSDFIPVVGQEYTLRVSKEGFESIEATTQVPQPVAISAVNVELDTTTIDIPATYDTVLQIVDIREATVSFQDPASERNHYELAFFMYDTLIPGTGYQVTDTVRRFERLKLASNDPAVDNTGNEVAVDLEGLDASPFDESSVSSWPLVFTDELFNGRSYALPVRLIASVDEATEPQLYVALRSITQGEYDYLRAFRLQITTGTTPFSEPVQIYDNVENGYGIVSGSSVDWVIVDLVSE